MFRAIVKVTLKEKILDPQGKAIESSLHNLSFKEFSSVRTGKTIEMSIDADDLKAAKDLVHSACAKLLANPVTEDYEFEILDNVGITVSQFSSRQRVGNVSGQVG